MTNINEKFNHLINLIKKYQNIVIYHHCFPDLDTLGSQYGLYSWIKDNFKNKDIILYNTQNDSNISDFNDVQTPEWFSNDRKILSIIVDVNRIERVDHGNTIKLSNMIVCIDHHSNVPDKKIDYTIIDFKCPATCQLLAEWFLKSEDKYIYSKRTANFLFYGLITDTNRFLNSNTNINSLKVLQNMYEKDINAYENYLKIYHIEINSAKLYGHIMSNFVINGKLSYFYLSNATLKKFNVPFHVGKTFVNAMRNIADVDIFILITENIETNLLAFSIRSIHKQINLIAEKYNGGGHKQAAGIKINLDKKDLFQQILDDYAKCANEID